MFVTAGGGSGALHALLSTPGASRFIAEARVPYSPEALEHFLGEKPEQSVSPETARALAAAAFRSQVSSFRLLSIACTAALQTDRERRGADRAFICLRTADSEKVYALHFSQAPRAEQEALLSDWLLILIALSVGAERGLILPGSFNPVHQGHLNLLKAAEATTGLRGVFELSCANVDKPQLEEGECLRRAAAIHDLPVLLTSAPRFVRKAELFPKSTFVLGYDTAARLIDYAAGDEWKTFQSLEARFLVAGRLHSGRFQRLEDLSLPSGFEGLFEAVPETLFREDVSSTELRG